MKPINRPINQNQNQSIEPSLRQLEGVDAWLSFGVAPADVEKQAAAAVKAGVKSLVIVAEGEGAADFSAAEKALDGSSTSFTFVQVAGIEDGVKEGGPITLIPTTAEEGATAAGAVSREDGQSLTQSLCSFSLFSFGLVCQGCRDDAVVCNSLKLHGQSGSHSVVRHRKLSQHQPPHSLSSLIRSFVRSFATVKKTKRTPMTTTTTTTVEPTNDQ